MKNISHMTNNCISEKNTILILLTFSLGIKVIYIYFTKGTTNLEVINYTSHSMTLQIENWYYLGPPAFGGGWRIPSFFFYPFNYFFIHILSYYGFLICLTLLNTLGLFYAYLIITKITNYKISLLTLLIASMTPFGIILSTSLWNPNFVFSFSMISLHYLIQSLKRDNAFIISSYSLSVLVQYHLIGYFLLPIYLIIILTKKIKKTTFILATVPWAILFFGYFYFEIQNNFINTNKILETGVGQNSKVLLQNFASFYFVAASGTPILSELFSHPIIDFYNDYFITYWIPISINFLSVLLIMSGFVYYGKKVWIRLQREKYNIWALIKKNLELSIVLLWVWLPILIFFIIHKTYVPRYAIIIYPLIVGFKIHCYFYLLQKYHLKSLKILGFIFLLFATYQLIAIYHLEYANLKLNKATALDKYYELTP